MAKEEKQYRKVIPCGHLYVYNREYYLLSPCPVTPDWDYQERRFAVVPTTSIDFNVQTGEMYFSFARHIIVKGEYIIEYSPTIGKINVWDLGDIDLANPTEVIEQKEELEPDWHQLELSDMIRSMEENNG